MKARLDRPRVLTPQVQAAIVQALAEGSYLNAACRAAGTTKDCFNYWRRLYESGAEHAQVYTVFYTACARASAIAEGRALDVVRSGQPGWQGPAWFLGRRFPERWGRRRIIAVDASPPRGSG